ncbi:MAG: hypothetical protein IAG13_19785, partial [Deltaproteobacteria bacterium]|nr:hypothetical protein [Nannocystaceae bacterium]
STAAHDGGAEHAADDGPLEPGSDERGADADDDGGRGDSSGAHGDIGSTGEAVGSDGADAADPDNGESSDASATGASGSEGGGAPACPQEVLSLLWAADAELGAPMELVPTDANLDPEIAASVVEDSGTVSFAIDFACPGEYSVWGLVWDYAPGGYANDDPDSFFVGVGGAEYTWRYGCQTGEQESGLSWQSLAALQVQPCDADALVIDVAAAGTVEIEFRNREAGYGSQVAGIGAIVVSSDAAADPYELYAPY